MANAYSSSVFKFTLVPLLLSLMFFTLSVILSLGLCITYRLWTILPHNTGLKKKKRGATETCSLGVFLGSGGHTTEALALLSSVPFDRYSPRVYIVSEGDVFSERKAEAFEKQKEATDNAYSKAYTVLVIPRARRVHQSLIRTPPSALNSLMHALYHLTYLPYCSSKPLAEVLLLNGPGTCFVLCIAAYISRFVGIPSPRLIYVESFARVNRLSLSGKLLRPLVDRFVVQWPELLRDGGRGECRGWLV